VGGGRRYKIYIRRDENSDNGVRYSNSDNEFDSTIAICKDISFGDEGGINVRRKERKHINFLHLTFTFTLF
jgi:hypothetical protein